MECQVEVLGSEPSQRVIESIVAVVPAAVFLEDASSNRASSSWRSCAANSISASLANVGVGSPLASSWCSGLSTTRNMHIPCLARNLMLDQGGGNESRSNSSEHVNIRDELALCAIQLPLSGVQRYFLNATCTVLGSKCSGPV